MRILTLTLALLFAAPVALASHEEGCTPGAATNATQVGSLHVWVQPSGIDVSHASWGVWEEANGIDGLQRHDVVFDETCRGHFPADTEIVAFYAL